MRTTIHRTIVAPWLELTLSVLSVVSARADVTTVFLDQWNGGPSDEHDEDGWLGVCACRQASEADPRSGVLYCVVLALWLIRRSVSTASSSG